MLKLRQILRKKKQDFIMKVWSFGAKINIQLAFENYLDIINSISREYPTKNRLQYRYIRNFTTAKTRGEKIST